MRAKHRVRAHATIVTCWAGGALLVGASGCESGCKGVGLPSRISPADTTLAVGGTVYLEYITGGACANRGVNHLTDVVERVTPTTWHTADTLVLMLDTASGMVTGRQSGDATVSAADGTAGVIHVR